MSPLLILATGVIIVLGMIILFRINAFVALITAAMVVSVMAPGEVGSKISRVADAFGKGTLALAFHTKRTFLLLHVEYTMLYLMNSSLHEHAQS